MELSGVEVIKHLAAELELTAADLGRPLGQVEIGPKILLGHRQVSRLHAARLGEHFGLPAEIFLR